MTETTNTVLSPETVKVGDGVTMGVGSDRYAGTVTKTSPSGKTIEFTFDTETATEGSNYYGSQEYTYESVEAFRHTDEYGFTRTNVHTARWNVKRGCFMSGSSRVGAGRRSYRDPSF